MKILLHKKFVLAVLCLLVLPATASADAVVSGPCGVASVGATTTIFGPCPLLSSFTSPLTPGGGTALYGAQATFATNNFLMSHSPVLVLSGAGQTNIFAMSINSGHIFPIWTVPGPVPTQLSLIGTVNIFEPGASVTIQFSGQLGDGSPLHLFASFTESTVFSLTAFGNQPIFAFDDETGRFEQPGTAVSRLSITINGAASFSGSSEFAGAIPEPSTMLLLGTGLAGVAMKMRKRFEKPKGRH